MKAQNLFGDPRNTGHLVFRRLEKFRCFFWGYLWVSQKKEKVRYCFKGIVYLVGDCVCHTSRGGESLIHECGVFRQSSAREIGKNQNTS